MKWTDVRHRIREIWPEIAEHVPERSPRSDACIKFEDRLVFEAALNLVWFDKPMRKPLGPPYPTVHPLYRRIAVLVRTRAIDKLWSEYLKRLGDDELDAWKTAFARSQAGRRGGIGVGLAWYEIMRRGVVRRPRRRKKA
jgi:hypothetical protein